MSRHEFLSGGRRADSRWAGLVARNAGMPTGRNWALHTPCGMSLSALPGEAAVEGPRPGAMALVEKIEAAQTTEIAEMKRMLAS